MNNNVPHIFDRFEESINRDWLTSQFLEGTLCIVYNAIDVDKTYTISIEKTFNISNNLKRLVNLSDFKQV